MTVGGDLEPETLLTAYRSGLFPMRQSNGDLTWWSPDPRGVLTVDALRVADSLRRSRRRFEIRVDTAFEAVIDACADRSEEEYHWITAEIKRAYGELHRLGWAHSVEAWSREDPSELVGGLYGVCIGGLFGGESMFSGGAMPRSPPSSPSSSSCATTAAMELAESSTSSG